MAFVFQRGETISIALDAVAGDVSTVTAVTASMKKKLDSLPAIPLTVTTRAAIDGNPAGWTCTLSPALSADLPLGDYLADARLTIGGGVEITEPVEVRINEAVTKL